MELDININPTLTCPGCKKEFKVSQEMSGKQVECSECDTKLNVILFPELFRKTSSVEAKDVSQINQEASCFFHENKVASSHCTQCGRFLCKLCELEIGSECLCPSCASGDNKSKKKSLKNRTILYDKIAMYLTVYPIFLIFAIYFTFITAPIGIIVAIKYWNKQETIIPRTKFRFVLSIIFAVLEIIAWISVAYYLFNIIPKYSSEIQ